MIRESRIDLKAACVALVSASCFLGMHSARAEWNFGIGTGVSQLNIEGDQGFNTQIAGPVVFPVDMDPDDVSDLMESAFGFGGYATNGTWVIQYSLVNLALEGQAFQTVADTTVGARLGFDVTGAEVAFGYPIVQGESGVLRVIFGVRYLEHDLSADLSVGANTASRGVDYDWTDVLVGLTADVPLGDDGKWSWNARLDASGGDSEGTTLFNTGLTRRFGETWSAGISVTSQDLDLENGVPGDSDFYLYDADETSLGINFLYHW